MPRTVAHLLPLALTLAAGFAGAPTGAHAAEPRESAAAATIGGETGAPPIRTASPPSDLDRARVERWYRVWREEAAALDRHLEAALASLEAADHRGLRPRCIALAGALLELDRPRVLPVPDRAADLHLRRALRHMARAVVTCLTKRPYAARHALEQAADARDEALRILHRYRRPANPSVP